MKRDNICIIIVTYNAMNWLQQCLESCEGYSIVIVDNCSTDSTIDYIKKNYSEIILFQKTKNLGFGQANNIGISYALNQGADYVFLLNQDAYLENNTIEKLIEVHQRNTEFGIVSPIHLNGKGDKLDFNFSNYIGQNKQLQFDALKQDFKKLIYEVPFVNAAAWLLPISTFKLVGGFDPIFYHYAEDDNYCQRLLFHDFMIGVVPNSYILHDRENRNNVIIENIDDKLKLKERLLKYKLANINIDVDNKFEKEKKEILTLIVKLFIKLKFSKVFYYIKELKLIGTIKDDILLSRKINMEKGSHYLDYE